MKEVSLKLKLKTSKASPNAISSQESAAGLSPCNSQESVTKQDYGREVRRASRSALPENSSGNSTHGTSRQSSSTSSASAALQSSLGSRLRQQLQNRGCAIYKLTWKEKTTPSGLPYSQLVASVPRIKETVSSLERSNWPTPRSSDGEKNVRTLEGSLSEIRRKGGPQDVAQAAAIAAWPTPTTRDHKDGKECQNVPTNSLLGREVWRAAWPSPTANSNDRSAAPENALTTHRQDGSKIQQRLQDFAAITQPIRITASGQMLTGSDAGMESSGQLNPAHSRWLMGFPPEWDDCAVTAMQSYRKSLPNSYELSWVPLAKRLRTKK